MFADPWSRDLPRKGEQRNTAENDGDEPDTLRVELDTATSLNHLRERDIRRLGEPLLMAVAGQQLAPRRACYHHD